MAQKTVWSRLKSAWPFIVTGVGLWANFRGNDSPFSAVEAAELSKKAFGTEEDRKTYNGERNIWRATAILCKRPGYKHADEILERFFNWNFHGESVEAKILGWYFSNEFQRFLADSWYRGNATFEKLIEWEGETDIKYTGKELDLEYQVLFLKFMVDTTLEEETEEAGFRRLVQVLKSNNIPVVPDQHIVLTIGRIFRSIPGFYDASVVVTEQKTQEWLDAIIWERARRDNERHDREQTRSGRFWKTFTKFF